MMQRDGNTMCDVFVVFVNLYTHLFQFAESTNYQKEIISDIESRWKTQEQHLFLLSFALHPRYRKYFSRMIRSSHAIYGTWTRRNNPFSAARLAIAAKFYFGKHKIWLDCMSAEEKELLLKPYNEERRALFVTNAMDNLACDLRMWVQNEPIDCLNDREWNEQINPVEFWARNAIEHPELARLGQYLLSCPVQSANCERLFKSWVLFHTKARNRLDPSKTQGMAKVRRVLQHQREQEKREQEKRTSSKATTTNKPTKSKNRFVNPAPRPSLVDLQLTQETFASQTQTQSQSPSSAKVGDNGVILETSASSDDDESVVDGDAFEGWKDAMDLAKEDDDDSILDALDELDDDNLYDPPSKETVPVEECYEVSDDELQPLPDVDDKSFPQENRQYFLKRKESNYVRRDAMPLASIYAIAEHVEKESGKAFPSMISLYGDKVPVVQEGW